MNRRFQGIPETRPQRALEGWMVLAVVIGLAIGASGLVLKTVIVPAFTSAVANLEHPGQAR